MPHNQRPKAEKETCSNQDRDNKGELPHRTMYKVRWGEGEPVDVGMSPDHNSEGYPSQEARFNSCLRYVDAFSQQLYFFLDALR